MIAARQIFLGRGGAKLPYDAEVAWLESTGTQWIDTGWLFQKDIRIVLQIRYLDTTYGWGRNAGAYEVLWSNKGAFYFGYGRSIVPRSNGVDYVLDLDFTAGAMVAKVNGDIVRSTTGTQPTLTRIGLFSVFSFDGTTPSSITKCRHGGITIYKDDVAVLDFVPVRFTNELGQSEGAMYDRVSEQLFRNQGTGAFVLGPDK